MRAFHALVRRRPFLVQRLEEVLTKLLTSLEFFDNEGRQKIAIGAILCNCLAYQLRIVLRDGSVVLGPLMSTNDRAVCAVTALVFTEKLGVLPERVFESMFNDRLVAKGTIIAMVTEIFKQYMAITDGNVEDLVTLLAKAKVSNRLLDYFPPGQQTEAAFKSHFEKEGLDKLVRSFLLFLIEGDAVDARAEVFSSVSLLGASRMQHCR